MNNRPVRFCVIAVILLATVCHAAAAQSLRFPSRPLHYISDDAGLLSTQAEADLNSLLRRVENQSGIEILVVTIDQLPEHRGDRLKHKRVVTIENYAQEMFNRFQIGKQPRNRGVLLLIVPQNRKCRIELGAGYARSTNAIAKRIIDNTIVPAFRLGEYERGIEMGVKQIATSIVRFELTGDGQKSSAGLIWIGSLIAVTTTSLLIGGSLLVEGKRGWGWVIVGLIYIQYLRLRNSMQNSARGVRGDTNSGWDDIVGSDFFGGSSDASCTGGFSDGGGASGDW